MTADWLINNRFGYTNRGLFGTLVLSFFKDSNSILNFLSIALISTYIAIFNLKRLCYICSYFFTCNIHLTHRLLGILSLFLLISATKTKTNKKYIFDSIMYTIFTHIFFNNYFANYFEKDNKIGINLFTIFMTFLNFIFFIFIFQ